MYLDRRRPPITWPNGARIDIIPCVAFETWPPDLVTPETTQNEDRPPVPKNSLFRRDLCSVTDREFGERVGVFRMLDIFAQEGIHTSFFLNAINLERCPEACKAIQEAGHELASENYIHDYSFMKTFEQEHEDLRKTVRLFEQKAGQRPVGYLSTGVRPSNNTPEIIAEEGYEYWMDPQHEEIPYTLSVKGKKLVVMSYLRYLNDYSTMKSVERIPQNLLSVWKDTFDQLYLEGETYPSMMAWGLHPFLSGRPYRAKVLREFIRYAKGHPGVWFARCQDVARWWKDHYSESWVEEWPNIRM